MNRSFYLYFLILLTFFGCTTHYKTLENQTYLTDENRTLNDIHKYYQNDSLNLTLEINWGNRNLVKLGLQDRINRERSRILTLTNVNPKKDLILYSGKRIYIILKKSKIDLSSFARYNVEDPIMQFSWDKSDKLIYRKTIVDRKNKLLIVNDIIPFHNNYLSTVQYVKCDEDESPTLRLKNPDYLYVYSEWYKSTLRISKLNAHNINSQKRYINKDPYVLLDENFKNIKYNNYRTTVLAATKSQQYRNKESKQLFDRVLATYYSFAHEQRKSDSLWAVLTQQTRDTTFNQGGTIDDLLKRADSAQIVMFNEVSNCPQHRYLVGTLLGKFYQKGFRYLGLEALKNDSLLTKRGFPTSVNGFYLREPVMANLVRAALKMGFKVFGYDSKFDDTRDIDQAKNIYDKTFSKDHDAKVLILSENDHIDRKNMAGRFETISGITPLTIDQTYTYLHHLNNENKKDEAYIIQDNGLKDKPNVDFILWNDLKINNNYFSLQETKPVMINIPDSVKKEATIICIYNKNETTIPNKNVPALSLPVYTVRMEILNNLNIITPIPVDLHVINNNEKAIEFSLCAGEYMILYFDEDGYLLSEESRNI
jgi:hypothetical protein